MTDNSVELFKIPEVCPACFNPTVVDGQFLFCKSKSCSARLPSSVKAWINNLGLLHWGESLIEKLTDPADPKILSIGDLYRLSVNDIASCCSGLKFAQKCWKILHSNKSIPLQVVLSALNIQNLGVSTSADIVGFGFDTIDKILNLTTDDLCKVPNIGKLTAQTIYDGLQEKRAIIVDLSTVLDIKPPSSGVLSGKTFCITGELSKPRKAFEKMIIDAGGSVKGSVNSSLSCLITNDPNTNSSKMVNAKKHGIKVISESDLLSMIG